VSINSKDATNQIFDLILTEALKEDCEREIELFKNVESEHIFSEKFEKEIKTIKYRLKRKQNARNLRKSAPKFATAAAAAIVIVALATNPSVSAFFRNIIVRLIDGFNQHEFIDDVVISIEDFNQELRPAYLPEGYQISFALYSPISMYVSFINQRDNMEDDTSIALEYSIAGDAAFSIAVENAEQYYVSVNGREAIFYETTTEDKTGYLFWNSGGYAFVLTAQIELEEFVKIAESIKF
jgi:hypothetical protein